MKGYIATIGVDIKNSGTFKYFLDKKEAEAWVETEGKFYKELTGNLWQSKIAEIELRKCATPWCHELVPEEQNICLNCEHIIEDSRWEYEDDMEI